MNFIIYDERVDQKFGMIDQQLLWKRYLSLYHNWEQKNMKSALINLLLLKVNTIKYQIPIIKEPKIVNIWERTDTIFNKS